MSEDLDKFNLSGIPKEIIEKFLKRLEAEKFPTNIIERLNESILEKGDISDATIKSALSPEE